MELSYSGLMLNCVVILCGRLCGVGGMLNCCVCMCMIVLMLVGCMCVVLSSWLIVVIVRLVLFVLSVMWK